MVAKRTNWDPRSEMAKDAVDGMTETAAVELLVIESRIAVLVCQHWIHSFAELSTPPGLNLFCQYCYAWQRLLKVVKL